MGINISICCCCDTIYGMKQETNRETANLVQEVVSFNEDVDRLLEESRERTINLLSKEIQSFYNNKDCTISLSESPKGHILKISFNIPKSPETVHQFLCSVPRPRWDKLIESCSISEQTSRYKIISIKYKSQISYSAKELVVACRSEVASDRIFVYYTSLPDENKPISNRIVVFEGGYTIQGIDNSSISVGVHFTIGGNALTRLLQKICEKVVPETIATIIQLLEG